MRLLPEGKEWDRSAPSAIGPELIRTAATNLRGDPPQSAGADPAVEARRSQGGDCGPPSKDERILIACTQDP